MNEVEQAAADGVLAGQGDGPAPVVAVARALHEHPGSLDPGELVAAFRDSVLHLVGRADLIEGGLFMAAYSSLALYTSALERAGTPAQVAAAARRVTGAQVLDVELPAVPWLVGVVLDPGQPYTVVLPRSLNPDTTDTATAADSAVRPARAGGAR